MFVARDTIRQLFIGNFKKISKIFGKKSIICGFFFEKIQKFLRKNFEFFLNYRNYVSDKLHHFKKKR